MADITDWVDIVDDAIHRHDVGDRVNLHTQARALTPIGKHDTIQWSPSAEVCRAKPKAPPPSWRRYRLRDGWEHSRRFWIAGQMTFVRGEMSTEERVMLSEETAKRLFSEHDTDGVEVIHLNDSRTWQARVDSDTVMDVRTRDGGSFGMERDRFEALFEEVKSGDCVKSREQTERDLSHAAGALGDIYLTITSCVSQDESAEVHAVCESVLERMLSSDHRTHHPPLWCNHTWERDLWAKYLRGEIDACAQGSHRNHPIPDAPAPPVKSGDCVKAREQSKALSDVVDLEAMKAGMEGEQWPVGGHPMCKFDPDLVAECLAGDDEPDTDASFDWESLERWVKTHDGRLYPVGILILSKAVLQLHDRLDNLERNNVQEGDTLTFVTEKGCEFVVSVREVE